MPVSDNAGNIEYLRRSLHQWKQSLGQTTCPLLPNKKCAFERAAPRSGIDMSPHDVTAIKRAFVDKNQLVHSVVEDYVDSELKSLFFILFSSRAC